MKVEIAILISLFTWGALHEQTKRVPGELGRKYIGPVMESLPPRDTFPQILEGGMRGDSSHFRKAVENGWAMTQFLTITP